MAVMAVSDMFGITPFLSATTPPPPPSNSHQNLASLKTGKYIKVLEVVNVRHACTKWKVNEFSKVKIVWVASLKSWSTLM